MASKAGEDTAAKEMEAEQIEQSEDADYKEDGDEEGEGLEEEEEENESEGENLDPTEKKLRRLMKMPSIVVLTKLRPGIRAELVRPDKEEEEKKDAEEKNDEETEGKETVIEFTMRLECDGQLYIGKGATKAQARTECAKQAVQAILAKGPPDNLDLLLKKKRRREGGLPKPGTKHPVMLLNEIEPSIDFQIISNPAPSTNDMYIVAASCQGQIFQGVGKQKKTAKADAAKNVLEKLFDYKYPVIPGMQSYRETFGEVAMPEEGEEKEMEQRTPVQLLQELKGKEAVYTELGQLKTGLYGWQVRLGTSVYEGQGWTKRQAKCVAAANTLAGLWGFDAVAMEEVLQQNLWGGDQPMKAPVTSVPQPGALPPSSEVEHPCVTLIRYRPEAKYEFKGSNGEGPNQEFLFTVETDGETFEATGRNKKLAKAEVARKALEFLVKNGEDIQFRTARNRPPSHSGGRGGWGESQGPYGAPREKRHRKNETFEDIYDRPPLQLLHDLKGKIEFQLIDSNPEPPNTWYKMSAIIDGQTYIGKGSNKKEAKRKCAEIAILSMEEQGLIEIPTKRPKNVMRGGPQALPMSGGAQLPQQQSPGGPLLATLDELQLLERDPDGLWQGALAVCNMRVHLLTQRLHNAQMLSHIVAHTACQIRCRDPQTQAAPEVRYSKKQIAASTQEINRRLMILQEEIEREGVRKSVISAHPALSQPLPEGLEDSNTDFTADAHLVYT